MTTQKLLIVAAFGLWGSHSVFASEVVENPPSPLSLTSNVGFVSNYFFRGQTQTWDLPAVQGGFDASHLNGLSAGIWGSTVSGDQFAGGHLELDLYGGYTYKLSDDVSLGLSAIAYLYPGANVDRAASCVSAVCKNIKYDTYEIAISAAWKTLNAKVSYALNPYFAATKDLGYTADTTGTVYAELNGTYAYDDQIALQAHVGWLQYANELAVANASGKKDPSYMDLKFGVTYTTKSNFSLGVFYADATNDKFYENLASNVKSTEVIDLNVGRPYVSLTRTF